METMSKKIRIKRNLIRIPTRFVDTTPKSPLFFNITYIPDFLTSGKNVFKIKGNKPNFVENSSVLVEALDSNGSVIYHEVLTDKDDDRSLSVILYVYEDTAPGTATITFIGTSIVNLDGSLLSTNDIRQNNIKYVHNIEINQTRRNDSQIIYIEKPVIDVNERRYSIIEEKFLGITSSGGESGSKVRYFDGTASYQYNYGKPTITSTEGSFLKDFNNGTIRFKSISDSYYPAINFSANPFDYNATVTNVITPYIMEVSESAYIYGNGGEKQLVTSIVDLPYEATFSFDSRQRNVTQNRKSYAELEIDKLDPDGGKVSRVQVQYKSSNKPSTDYKIAYDAEVSQKNLLVDEQTEFIQIPIGTISRDS
jgi:hypothetical protein